MHARGDGRVEVSASRGESGGLGLAFGVLADAFLVRMTLVPAVLALLGDSAWKLPPWLNRTLPNVDIEGDSLSKQLSATDARPGMAPDRAQPLPQY